MNTGIINIQYVNENESVNQVTGKSKIVNRSRNKNSADTAATEFVT